MRVFVIGAGIAGLAAADILHRAGVSVTVFEADADVGGRIRSVRFHQHDIECGAQFLSTGYRYLLPLLKRYPIRAKLQPLSHYNAIERERKLYRIDTRTPWDLLKHTGTNWGEVTRAAIAGATWILRTKHLNSSHYASFVDFDDEDASLFCERTLGGSSVRDLTDAYIHGLYFHRLSGTSRALVTAILGLSGETTLTLTGAWQDLPRAISEALDVRTSCFVEEVREREQVVDILIEREWDHADALVLAVPANIACELLAGVTISASEKNVLAAGYASTIHIALALRPTWVLPENLANVYGIIMAPNEVATLASVTLQSGRCSDAQNKGDVVSVMLGSEAGREMMNWSEEQILRCILPQIERYFPDIRDNIVDVHVQRWPVAEPLSPVGRARAVKEYRQSLPPDRRIFLAGDYLGSPWTDGAAETGIWAARRLLECFNKH